MMPSSNEDEAKRIYELEMQRIDSERRGRRKRTAHARLVIVDMIAS